MNIYLQLTEAFNRGGLRAVICSGQAVVLHRLAIMSKDGDWILREEEAALAHVRSVLAEFGATYRYGAPLDVRWMRGGWSSHLEFRYEGIRIRTDFFTRPPRLTGDDLRRIWVEQEAKNPPFVNARDLALIKMTQREKDYPVIGELARLMEDPRHQLLFSRSPRDLVRICETHPGLVAELSSQRPLLASAPSGDLEDLGAALDAERRKLMRQDEERLDRYRESSASWAENWPRIQNSITELPLAEAHDRLVVEAEGTLPYSP